MKLIRSAGRSFIAPVALCAVTGAAHATSDAQTYASVRRDPLFVSLDVNRDGRICRHEAARDKDFLAAFGESDDNHDGCLSPAEFMKARAIYDRVRAARYLSDSLITARVKAALLRDEQLSVHSIVVETNDGRVTLSGSVIRAAHRIEAGRVAASVAGVTGVNNVLHVKPTFTNTAAP